MLCAGLLFAVLVGGAVLPPVLPWDGKSRELVVAADDPWITPSEKTGLTETPRYDETMEWLGRLVEASPELEWISLGKSAEGREIRMVLASASGSKTPTEMKAGGKPTVLAHAGIHSGEIDGKDAGLMLLRDMTVGGSKKELLDRANFLFVPILSVDAHERFSAFSRMNQRGPKEMGWRTNRRNLNLNRDYAKLETEELRALVAAVNAWEPDLYLDLHVTDGADYQYDVTYGYNGTHAWSPAIAGWLDTTFRPAIDRQLEAMGHIPGPLSFGVNGRDMTGGNFDWTAPPRFSTGWGDARHLPTVLVENHSLKPYDQRVLGTYVFLETTLRIVGAHGDELRKATAADRAARPDKITLAWQVDSAATPKTVAYKAVSSELYDSPISGQQTVRWTGKPVEQVIPIIRANAPLTTVRRPANYYIPAAWYPLVEILERHGVRVERLAEARRVNVERYRLPDATLDAATSPFEGRTRYLPGTPVAEDTTVDLPTSSFVITTGQPLGTLAVALLEPEAPDSLFQWGYLSSILQRTEYFEPYVMEPLAAAMLDADPELAKAFEAALTDETFAADADKRLEWFYERSPFYDAEYRVYPVYRSRD
jgi:hypothetical protein